MAEQQQPKKNQQKPCDESSVDSCYDNVNQDGSSLHRLLVTEEESLPPFPQFASVSASIKSTDPITTTPMADPPPIAASVTIKPIPAKSNAPLSKRSSQQSISRTAPSRRPHSYHNKAASLGSSTSTSTSAANTPRDPRTTATTTTMRSVQSPLLGNSSKLPKAPLPEKDKKYMSIVDYHSSTTTTTTTTKITSTAVVPPGQLLMAVEEINNALVNGGGGGGHSPTNLSQDDTSSSKPLLAAGAAGEMEMVRRSYGGTQPIGGGRQQRRSTTTTTGGGADEHKRIALLGAHTPAIYREVSIHGRDMEGDGDGEDGEDGERETWTRKIDFLLSVIGFAVDLANVWRFPYLCFKNGGGAFLIPYTMMVLLAGIPLFYMELALGQFHRKGPITTWGKICPLFKGIGYCVIMTALYTDFFYNIIIAFALHYFFASLTTQLPWTKCDNPYNSKACYEPSWSHSSSSGECATAPVVNLTAMGVNSSFMPEEVLRPISAAEEYFYKRFLGLHEEGQPNAHVKQSLGDLGSINWQLVLSVIAVYLICYFSLWKGIKMSGKVVWFTAIFPYVVLFCLLIRGITLPGAEKGIAYYLSPNLTMLWEPSVWQDAATQVFFSLGPGFGVLMAYSSYNEFHNNVYFDPLLTNTINCCTSFLAGFVIFSVLGYMSCKSGKPIHEVAQEGPGLVFVVYPEALATMPGATLWSLIFFLMLLTLGLDSSFGGSEAIITGLSDEFPIIKRNREVFVAVLFMFYMVIGLFMCTQGGMLIMEWLIVYGTTWGLLIAVFCEAITISFFYGIDRFIEDIHEMLGFRPGWYWRLCWTVGAPLFLLAMILSSFINLQPLQYQDYVYPTSANIFGIIFALSSVSAIPLVGIYTLYNQKGADMWEKLRLAITPTGRSRFSSIGGAIDQGGGVYEEAATTSPVQSSANDVML